MTRAWLSLGSNMGDKKANVRNAIRALDDHPDIHVTKRSGLAETAPWGKTDQDDFINAAIEINSILGPLDLLESCLMVEQAMGRERGEKWGPRIIDIDIIAYDNVEMKTDQLTLPHPLAHERDFVLNPLREIAPEVADDLVARMQKTQD